MRWQQESVVGGRKVPSSVHEIGCADVLASTWRTGYKDQGSFKTTETGYSKLLQNDNSDSVRGETIYPSCHLMLTLMVRGDRMGDPKGDPEGDLEDDLAGAGRSLGKF